MATLLSRARKQAIFCAALAVLTAACGRFGPKGIAVDPVLEALVPPDTRFIAGADIVSLRDSKVNPKYVSILDLLRLTVPLGDLQQVLACSSGGAPLLLARGRVGSSTGQPRISYKGHTFFGAENSAVMFVDSETIAEGPAQDLRAMIDRGGPSHGLSPDLKKVISSIPADRQIWAAFDGGLSNLTSGNGTTSNLDSLLALFRGVETGRLSFDLRHGIQLDAQLDCDNDGHARHVHDAIRGFIEFGRAAAPRNGAVPRQVYDAIQVTQIETRVLVTAIWPPELADRVFDLLKHGG